MNCPLGAPEARMQDTTPPPAKRLKAALGVPAHAPGLAAQASAPAPGGDHHMALCSGRFGLLDFGMCV